MATQNYTAFVPHIIPNSSFLLSTRSQFILPTEANLLTPIPAPSSTAIYPHKRHSFTTVIATCEMASSNSTYSSPSSSSRLISATQEWKDLAQHRDLVIQNSHLRELLKDQDRNSALQLHMDNPDQNSYFYIDYSRQRVTQDTMRLLFNLARKANLQQKIHDMLNGTKINVTENRAVLHTALRANRHDSVMLDGQNVVDQVYQVLDKIQSFSEKVRSGQLTSATGKNLKNVIAVGIGGSYLGPEFLYEALKTEKNGKRTSQGRSLRFLANIDPVDEARAIAGLDPEETLVVIISKTFTTRETMINAKTIRDWLINGISARHPQIDPQLIISKQMVACSTNIELTSKFGIDPDNVFPFWDWVGGRYSVSSSVGALPLSLQYGYDLFYTFLQGLYSIDQHFKTTPLEQNIPVVLGLLGVWNISFLNYKTRVINPYSQALIRFPAHIQQVDMESNGKSVTLDGDPVDFNVGEINWGEPGTNGQHSYFQLLHMGQIAPCDFIGFIESQNPICEEGEPVSNHDELMANFFAQPDALANGKTPDECRAEGRPESLIPHVTFTGNRPSSSLLFSELNAFTCGQLLGIYEHRTAVQGFIWNINSFDQMGVELGKVLAIQNRKMINQARYFEGKVKGINSSTQFLLQKYIEGSVGCFFEHPVDDK